MQSLDVISVNAWNILLSLANLALLVLAAKRFLFRPVTRLLAEREAHISRMYAEARAAKEAEEAKAKSYQQKLDAVKVEADQILSEARLVASKEAEALVSVAEARAEQITREAQEGAASERREAEEGIRREIVDGAFSLAEQLLAREIGRQDHQQLVDRFISELEAAHGADR